MPEGFLSDCNTLRTIDFSNNKLTSLPEGFLSDCNTLRTIDFSNNKLISLPVKFLSGSHSDPQRACAFHSTPTCCGSLISIDLSRNDLTSLPVRFLSSSDMLESVNLSENKLTFLPKDFLSYASDTFLKSIDLSRNDLTFLPKDFLSPCPLTLTYINLDNNKLKAGPERFIHGCAIFFDCFYFGGDGREIWIEHDCPKHGSLKDKWMNFKRNIR